MRGPSFMERVEKTPTCWNWLGAVNDKGYGTLWVNGRHMKAHRYSYERHIGPLGELHALHSCDNPRCVNPDHLRAGTHQDNMADREARGRGKRLVGKDHGSTKLTEQQALEALASKESGAAIARRFGVSKSAVYAIRNGVNWKCLHAPA